MENYDNQVFVRKNISIQIFTLQSNLINPNTHFITIVFIQNIFQQLCNQLNAPSTVTNLLKNQIKTHYF